MLPDILAYGLDVVFCGTAKGRASATLGYYYAGPGNKFYSILHEAGFTPERLLPSECYTINKYKIGLTDLVHTEYGNDNQISKASYEIDAFIKKMEHYQPRYIGFTSKAAASFALGYKGLTGELNYGLHSRKIGKSKVFILPSTSGSGRKFWDSAYWHQLHDLCK